MMETQGNDSATIALDDNELALTDAYWRACNYLAVGMIYLRDNPLLKKPLEASDVKHRLLGHWGASPALSLLFPVAWQRFHKWIQAATPVGLVKSEPTGVVAFIILPGSGRAFSRLAIAVIR